MSDSAEDVVANCEFWMRVNLALEVCVKEALIHILHNTHSDPSYKGLPTDPGDLYQHMLRCCLLYTSPSPRDKRQSRMPSSA